MMTFHQLLRRFDFGLVDPVNPIRTKCHQIHIQDRMLVRVWKADTKATFVPVQLDPITDQRVSDPSNARES
jgi:hypothetical protein